MSTDRGMGKEVVVHICHEILLSHKKEGHSKWSKSDRERQIYDIAYMWNLKNGTNKLIYKTEIESQM